MELVPIIIERLRTLAKSLFPFEVIAAGVDAFPNASEAKILWAGFDEKSAELLELIKRAIEKELKEIGVEKETKPDAKIHGRFKFASNFKGASTR